MNESLQRWLEDFAREPDTAFDRLVRGVVPLGAASQLSLGEIIDNLFEPGDAALDTAAASWLEKYLLGAVPDGTSLPRWVSIVEEYFRAIATMELPKTGEILRRQHKRLRLWLHGFYEGPDRDPEGAYLLALTRAQADQRFSPLWRRLILGEELAERPYLGLGTIGFRKMPGPDGRESSDVPEGLLQALVELADRPGTGQAKWKQTMRSLFAAYRRSQEYWVDHLTPLLPNEHGQSKARDWLSALLPKISKWHPHNQVLARRANPVPVHVSKNWVQRVQQNPALCDTPEFTAFLDQQRAYAKISGDAQQINLAFNNLAIKLVRADRNRADLAVSLMTEALDWAPWDAYNWTSYAIVLSAAHRETEAINALWQARHRFAWDPFIRNELGRLLRQNGDLPAAEGVLRETVGLFPSDVVCRTGLAETLLAMERFEEAREVYAQACLDFPSNVFCRNGLADLLIDLGKADEAERMFREALGIDPIDHCAKGGLARALSIRSAKTRDEGLRDEAKRILLELADQGDYDARSRLRNFDEQWERATSDPTITFRQEQYGLQPPVKEAQQDRAIADMSIAERLGRAMLTLWQAEHATDTTLRASFCAHAAVLLEVPIEQIDDGLLAAYVETRGLVLLANGEARRALDYFEEQINHFGRGGWIGIRLGAQRARILLGEPYDADDDTEPPSSQSARFALYVAMVIQKLSGTLQESEVGELLKNFYPRAASLASRVQTNAKGELAIQSGAEMLGVYLQTRWFLPDGIQSAEDLDRPGAVQAIVERINKTRTDTFDVIVNATLAIAA